MAPQHRTSDFTKRIAGPGSRAWDITQRARRLAEDGVDVIHLSIGDPDMDTPAPVADACVASLRSGRTHYSSGVGEPALRSAVAERASIQNGVSIDPDQVIIFPGAQCALFSAIMCIAEMGDEVILLDPAYTTYDAVAVAGGSVSVRVPMPADRGFALDVDAIIAATTDKTRAVLINTPGNPTGAVYGREALTALTAFCAEKGIWLVSDEVYWSLAFDAPHVSPISCPGGLDTVVLVNSLSKSHAMTGWRVGWTIAPRDLCVHLDNLAQCMLFGVNQFVQDAAVFALSEEGCKLSEPITENFRHRRDLFCEALSNIPGIRIEWPAGGMFLLADVSAIDGDGERFANDLLDETGVAVVPGFAFGDSTTPFVRIGYLQREERLLEAAQKIRDFARRRYG